MLPALIQNDNNIFLNTFLNLSSLALINFDILSLNNAVILMAKLQSTIETLFHNQLQTQLINLAQSFCIHSVVMPFQRLFSSIF